MKLQMRKRKSTRLNSLIKICCLTGALVAYSACSYAALSNTTLPSGGQWVGGSSGTIGQSGNVMNIIQQQQNAVIKWNDFSIGANATVNFSSKTGSEFNILNYVNSGNVSQIYGTMNAKDGNVFLVNTAGTVIGKSAQINVGSLYVSNKKMNDTQLRAFAQNATINGTTTGAQMMSLGNIMANKITFDGDRIVLDTERVHKYDGGKLASDSIVIKTNKEDEVVLGYSAYDSEKKTYAGQNEDKKDGNFVIAEVNGKAFTKKDGYMWIENLEQLQAMNTNLSGNYALRNGIDATSTEHTAEHDAEGSENHFHFVPIGKNGEGKSFTGKLDGVDFSIFDLNIYADSKNNINLGLFGKIEGATIRNLTFVDGGIYKGKNQNGTDYTGSIQNAGIVAGHAVNSVVSNIETSASVIGDVEPKEADDAVISENIGGIIGLAENATLDTLHNTGLVKGHTNVGGIVGNMQEGSLKNSSNIGEIKGVNKYGASKDNQPVTLKQHYSHNIGGLVGNAANANIEGVSNNLSVQGGYNVGGIVGSGINIKITDAVNEGNITADGYTRDIYYYYYYPENYTGKVEGQGSTLQAANVGGIVGNLEGTSSLKNVTNDGGNISSRKVITGDTKGDIFKKLKEQRAKEYKAYLQKQLVDKKITQEEHDKYITDDSVEEHANIRATEDLKHIGEYYYEAGNVGGIVGRAGAVTTDNGVSTDGVNITITNAVNKESKVYGAHNVGGIAGYFSVGTVDNAVNNGGEIVATGARDIAGGVVGFALEHTDEGEYVIGNAGGIVGYMFGDKSFVKNSGNRGNVHSLERDFVGRNKYDKFWNVIDEKTEGYVKLSDIMQYTGQTQNIGGIVGKFASHQKIDDTNKESIRKDGSKANISGSYNTGFVQGYRNVGGVVGQLWNGTLADAYNLGDVRATRQSLADTKSALNLGGVVGNTTQGSRLYSFIYNVYNKGTVGDEERKYSGRHIGGVVGMLSGDLEKAYNTGNIYNDFNVVGGVVGHWVQGNITNVFNTGNITVYNRNNAQSQVGGIVGSVDLAIPTSDLTLSYAYNLGNIISTRTNLENTEDIDKPAFEKGYNVTGGIVGGVADFTKDGGTTDKKLKINNVYNKGTLKNVTKHHQEEDKLGQIVGGALTDNVSDDRIVIDANTSYGSDTNNYDNFDKGVGDGEHKWRMYKDGTPILNAFLPDWYVKNKDAFDKGVASGNIQLGTAANPLNTIIKDGNLSIDWDNVYDVNGRLNGRDDSFEVQKGSLTIKDFVTGDYFYSGNLQSNGDLSITAKSEKDVVNNIKFGSASNLSSGAGSISINNTSGSIAINGNVKAEKGITVTGKAVESIGAFTAGSDINITAADGNVDLLYGNNEAGKLSAGGSLNVSAKGEDSDIYIDADMDVNGKIAMNADGEIVLDISNIGKNGKDVDAMHKFLAAHTKDETSIKFAKADGKASNDNAMITVDMWGDKGFNLDKYDTAADKDAFVKALSNLKVINGVKNDTVGKYVNIWISSAEQLKAIQEYVKNGNKKEAVLGYNYALKNNIGANSITDFEAIGSGTDSGFTGTFNGRDKLIVGLNVSAAKDKDQNVGLFSHIGKGGVVKNVGVISSTFTGGAVGAIAGWNEGIIDNIVTFGNKINNNAVVKVPTGSSVGAAFAGVAGGIAGINSFVIGNVQTQDVVITGVLGDASTKKVSAAGGAVGYNVGLVHDATVNSVVTANNGDASALGGIVGVNNHIENRYWDDYVDKDGNKIDIGARLDNVESLGLVNGMFYKYENGKVVVAETENVGGIAGVNYNGGSIIHAYNEAKVYGSNGVGGIVGHSGADNPANRNKNKVENVVNSGAVVGYIKDAKDKDGNPILSKNTGGLIGNSINTDITNARNTGSITGAENVGGVVGNNSATSTMTNIINDVYAKIEGNENVGGIAGSNAGTITASDQANLINRGEIYGNMYVGGVAGFNSGTIENINTNLNLHIKDNTKPAQYFGGVVGKNAVNGTIKNATNRANVSADTAEFVGGVVGENDGKLLELSGNYGNVIGGSYVGGVVGKNNAAIGGVEAYNEGKVEGNNGGAGGLFGHNDGAITNSKLVNNGEVIGVAPKTDKDVAGTGGIFGKNTGEITKTTLANSTGGKVTGASNVGGLIGINTGIVTGGRDDEGNYYKYQVYNNGEIVGTGDNVGGLFGTNSGKVTAAYNTGAVTGEGNNVGGIAGVNDGTIDQVFNSVFNNGLISGTSNVGAIVGNNGGAVKNAYTTTKVSGNDDKLVGVGNTVDNTTDANNTAVWKTYGDGNVEGTNNLLSVFLTKLTFEKNENFDKVIYNAGKQEVTIREGKNVNGNIELNVFVGDTVIGTLTTASPDNDADAAHSLQDYLNANALLAPNKDAQNAGEYLLFGTQQISSNADNHNNLGFDIAKLKFEIKKATIDLVLNAVERNYGDATIIKGEYGYGFGESVNEAMKNELIGGITMTDRFDEAVDGLADGKKTNDAGDHRWGVTFTLSDKLSENYQFENEGKLTGLSRVNKAKLNVSLNEVNHIYGSINDKDYGISGVTGSTNGDNYTVGDLVFGGVADKGDGALVYDSADGKVTHDVNDSKNPYEWIGLVTSKNEKLNQNYEIVVDKGVSNVTKANLTITAGNVNIQLGEKPGYKGTLDKLVNGDSFTGGFGITDSVLEGKVGTHTGVIGIVIDGTVYTLTNDAWTETGFWKNYDIKLDAGDLTVTTPVDPEEPGIEDWKSWEAEDKYAWGKKREERERKAEIHYVDGGMEI